MILIVIFKSFLNSIDQRERKPAVLLPPQRSVITTASPSRSLPPPDPPPHEIAAPPDAYCARSSEPEYGRGASRSLGALGHWRRPLRRMCGAGRGFGCPGDPRGGAPSAGGSDSRAPGLVRTITHGLTSTPGMFFRTSTTA
jgi:hypothetical protein